MQGFQLEPIRIVALSKIGKNAGTNDTFKFYFNYSWFSFLNVKQVKTGVVVVQGKDLDFSTQKKGFRFHKVHKKKKNYLLFNSHYYLGVWIDCRILIDSDMVTSK